MKLSCRLAIALLAAAASVAVAQDKPVELRFATVSPQKSIWGQQYERLARAIEEETRGSVKLQIYFGGQLGSGNELIQQVARGRLDAGAGLLAFASTLAPELQLIAGLPMYWRSPAELDCMIDTALGPAVEQALVAKGVQLLGWTDAGASHLIGKKSFTKPADINGTKAASYGTRTGAMTWTALGANPASITIPEAPSAFQTGLIDVAAGLPVFYVASGLNKVAPVLTKMELFAAPVIFFMHKATWDALGADQRAGVQRAFARMPVAALRAEVRESEARALQAHVQGGGQVVAVSPAQRDAFRRLLSPLWPAMAQEAGPAGPTLLDKMEAGRKSCEKTG